MKSKQALIIILVVFLVSIITFELFRSTGPVEVGRTAPQFTLQDLAGREVSLEDYRGKIVILDFWATWCGPCRMTMPMLDDIQKEYTGKMSILAINLQEPKDVVREYIMRQGLHSEVLLDEDGSVGRQYGAAAIPMQLLIDQDGIIRYIVTGVENPRVIKGEINKLL